MNYMTRSIRIIILTVLAALVIVTGASATLTWTKTFCKLYNPKPESAINKAGCALCHTSASGTDGLNCYGKLLENKKVKKSTLKSIESKDADGDGFSNIDEIKAGTLPGDKKSKPSTKK